MNAPSMSVRTRRSAVDRERRVAMTATVSPSSSDIQVASTAVRSEVASASVTGTTSACCSPVVPSAR